MQTEPYAQVRSRTFHSVTTVRGLAALAVCWFHMGHWSGMLPEGVFRLSSAIGWLGPHIFFIVSGFVVPWSLYRARYHVTDAPRYLARRMLRLDPPYFATLLLVLVLSFLGSLIGLEEAFVLEWGRILSHLAYLTEILGQKWYNPVFWTLAIEFQYYILLALLFPLIAHPNAAIRRLLMLACLAAFAPFFMQAQTTWLMGYLPLFLLGFILFQYYAEMIGRVELWLWAGLLFVLVASFTYFLSLLAFVAFALILEDRFRNSVTEFLGRISYSLYLIHMPIGIPFVRILGTWAESDAQRITVTLASVPVCIFSAWLFYRLVENPSILLARRIGMHSKSKTTSGSIAPEAMT